MTAGGTTGGPTAPAAGTLIAAAPAAGAAGAAGATASTTPGTGKHSSATAHPKAKKPASSGLASIFTAPVDSFVQPFQIFHVIPLWIKAALGAAVALALAFAAIAFRSTRLASKKEKEFAEISAAAQTDPLTGILNRRGFMEAAERELHRASRYGRPFVLAYVDVRGLKTVNDTEGHLTGDQLLKAVAGLMTETARADDIVGRIGGDEFALLLAEQTVSGAVPVLRRINARVDEHRSAMEIRVPWELTIGVAAFPENGATLDDLIGVADRRLYEQRGIALR
ncbi:MAG: GGDEF domain-containing protein [Solirubrobacterales bacterium]|nr:GGDEF domain-containing protein [Solirubrobacterales bacterium]